ncbi:MAG: tetratricopeptide repeat protein [Desulfobacteraceae bacterium]|nr:MAG: tetratricopeptide repeat protein [Desulfobacteraceae bacterium]
MDFPSSDYLAGMEKVITTLTLKGMAAGNDGDFKMAFSDMEAALWLSQSLEKRCLEAVLLNNLGLLHTMNGAWDRALFFYECSMEIAADACPSDDTFLSTLKKNISCLFDPKVVTPKNQNQNLN